MNLEKKIKETILSGLVSESERRVGLEVEGLYYDSSFKRIPVNPTNKFSATSLLNEASGLVKHSDEFSYSLEPGGQLEWASGPSISLWDIQSQFEDHLFIENSLCADHGLGRLYLSLEPISSPKEIELIKAKKYQLMNDLFLTTGDLGLWMMRNTTSVQVNIDFTSEEDANEMAFVADAIQPFFSILFSNTPFMRGKPVGSANMRWQIWEDTDRNRCGSLFKHGIKNSRKMLESYVRWVQDVNTIFSITSEGIANSFEGSLKEMILADPKNLDNRIMSALHQSFTHVRFKSVLEVRAGDRPQKGSELAPAAFLLGLLTASKTRKHLSEIIQSWTDIERKKLNETAKDLSYNNMGPANKYIGDWLSILGDLSLQGLDERQTVLNIENERPFLEHILNDLVVNGPKTIQIQNTYDQYKGSLDQFIFDCCLDVSK